MSRFESRGEGPPRVLAIARDVTEAKLAEEALERAAFTDPLTQLANRVVFRETVAAALARGESAVVLFIDLDQFKAVNDLLGHLSGDELLRQGAVRMLECVRADDIVARLGGDEFAVFLREVTVEVGRLMSARIIERLGTPFSLDGRLVTISASVGITRLAGGSVDEVLKRADIALYSAKRVHSGTYQVFEHEMGRAVEVRQSLLLDLRGALSRGELSLEYQGLVQFGSERFSTFEALLRWHHPVHGRISPEVFVPLLEESGAINSVGAWVLDEACRQAAAWPGHANVAVNLSTVQLRAGDLAEQVSHCIARYGLKPHRLQLEMTESVLLENSDENLGTLEKLRELGVAVVLDDFGTGYSSLSYLRRFRFDKIKIDRSFIADVPADASAAAIVAAVVGLATRLGIPTTAEGVETQQQHHHLVQLGCREFQGYLFSRPVTADRLVFGLS